MTKGIMNTLTLAATLLPSLGNAAQCLQKIELQSKSLKVVSSYVTKGLTYGKAVKGPNGNIWTGTIDGTLLELDPATSNRIASEKKLTGGIQGALKNFGTKLGSEKLVVGTDSGYYCYDSNGAEITSKSDLGTKLSTSPIAYGSELLLVANNGLPYKINKDCTSISKASNGAGYGILTSPPSLLKFPQAMLVYGTKVASPSDMQKSIYSIVFASVGGSLSHYDLREEDGKVIFPPTVTQEISPGGTPKEKVLILTNNGKIVPATHEGIKRTESNTIDLHCKPTTPLADLGNGHLSVFCIDPQDKSAKCVVITSSGKEISRTTIRNFDDSSTNAIPTSEAFTFLDESKRQTAMMGFSDSTVKVVDIQTGVVLESFKTSKIVKTAPAYINESSFYVSEESGELPLELTKSYLLKLTKPAVVQTKTTQAPSICSAGEDSGDHVGKAFSSSKSFDFSKELQAASLR